MAELLYAYVFISLCVHGEAIRCFECQDVPYPRDCSRVRECDVDEFCFSEQVVTTGGLIVYNSGCLSKSRCSNVGVSLMGKRSERVFGRSTDLVTCVECCADSFCNRKGCGVKEIPLEERGLYCFNCDAVLDPKSCDKVAVCMKHEVCLLQTAAEFLGLPEIVYRSQCGKQSACDGVSADLGINTCIAKCCKTDFCNDNCETVQINSTTTKPIQSPSSTTVQSVSSQITDISTKSREASVSSTVPSVSSQITGSTVTKHTPSTTKAPKHCHDHNGYNHPEGHHTHLCFHVVITHLTWDDARSACKKEGGDLVILDTHEKAQLLRTAIHSNSVYKDYASYWIGARDFSDNEQFRWIDNSPVRESESDWAQGEPDSHRQDCIAMTKAEDFYWNNKNCSSERSYICQV